MYYIHRKIKNPFEDGILIGNELKEKINNPSLILFITSITNKEKIEKILDGIKQNTPLDNLIGCTSAGEFSENKETENGVLILAFNNKCKSAINCIKIDEKDNAYKKGIELIDNTTKEIIKKYSKIDITEKFLGFIFTDWDNYDEDELINAIASKLSFPLIGGTSADNLSFEKTYQIYKGNILEEHAVFGVVAPKKKFNILYGHGYNPTEYYGRITKTNGRIIEEIDGKPAYEVYCNMIHNFTKIPKEEINKYTVNKNNIDFTILYPLGIQDCYGNYRIVYIKKIENNLIISNHSIKEGTFVVLMNTSVSNTRNSLINEINKKTKEFKQPFTFIIECAVRKLISNPKMYKKYKNVVSENFCNLLSKLDNNIIDEDIKLPENVIGFNSYGESIIDGPYRFHNTITFTGVTFEVGGNLEINWENDLKYFGFNTDELKVIKLLIDYKLTAKELLYKTEISQTKLYATLNDLEKRGIINSTGRTPKVYYIKNLLKMLSNISNIIDCNYKINKEKRDEVLSKLRNY